MQQNMSFSHKKIPKYSAPFLVGRGHPSPYPTPQVPPIQLDPGYATDIRSVQFTVGCRQCINLV